MAQKTVQDLENGIQEAREELAQRVERLAWRIRAGAKGECTIAQFNQAYREIVKLCYSLQEQGMLGRID